MGPYSDTLKPNSTDQVCELVCRDAGGSPREQGVGLAVGKVGTEADRAELEEVERGRGDGVEGLTGVTADRRTGGDECMMVVAIYVATYS